MHIVLRAYGTRNAGVFVVQTGGFEDFGFVDEMVVVAQCRFVNGVNLCFWGLSLGLDCFFYNGHGKFTVVVCCRHFGTWTQNSLFDFLETYISTYLLPLQIIKLCARIRIAVST